MIWYLPVAELLFEGAEKCGQGYEKENIDIHQPYITIACDKKAAFGRGMNTICYRGQKIAAEYMKPPRGFDGFTLNGPSIGLYKDAEVWCLHNLTKLIADFK